MNRRSESFYNLLLSSCLMPVITFFSTGLARRWHHARVCELRSQLSPILRTEWSLRIHLWKRGREKMHPRYLLTDRGGIQIDHGWDEGEQDTETTRIMLLSRARWEQEMERYKLGSDDFVMDPKKGVILIEKRVVLHGRNRRN